MTMYSRFARSLTAIFDEAGVFSYNEWTRFLGLSSVDVLREWMTDLSVPPPDLLRIVLDTLELTADVPLGPIEGFKEMAAQPSTEVSPLGSCMGETVADYMKTGSLEFLKRLRKMPAGEQSRQLLGSVRPYP